MPHLTARSRPLIIWRIACARVELKSYRTVDLQQQGWAALLYNEERKLPVEPGRYQFKH